MALLAAVTVVGIVTGCSGGGTLSDNDRRVLAQLTEIAPQNSEIDGETTDVECWKPSESMLDDETFRVICRVHYDQAGTERYRDMICIGKLSSDPVTDYCYRWAFYSDMPVYEDQQGYSAD